MVQPSVPWPVLSHRFLNAVRPTTGVPCFNKALLQPRRETLEMVVRDLFPRGGHVEQATFWFKRRAPDHRRAVRRHRPQAGPEGGLLNVAAARELIKRCCSRVAKPWRWWCAICSRAAATLSRPPSGPISAIPPTRMR
jgi:hypothetical protein